MRYVFIVIFAAGLLGACSNERERGPATARMEAVDSAAVSPRARTYQAAGVVLSVTPNRSFVTIRHGDIEGFMDAMTMPMALGDTTLVDGIQPGDSVRFTLTVSSSGAHVSAMEKVE